MSYTTFTHTNTRVSPSHTSNFLKLAIMSGIIARWYNRLCSARVWSFNPSLPLGR